MPRNSSGVYSKPAGTTAIVDTDIEPAPWNQLTSDLGNEITNSLPRDGSAPMVSPLRLAGGASSVPGLSFATDITTGLYLKSAGTVAAVANGVEAFEWSADGLTGIPSINGGPLGGFHNKLVNPRFSINQTNAAASATLGSNVYWYDGWRAGPGGCTLSLSGGVVTIAAGTLVQNVDGNDIETGTHTINWVGTATCTVDGSAKIKGTNASLTRGTNCAVAFAAGTIGFPQLEPGELATAFEQRPQPIDQMLCQWRYSTGVAVAGAFQSIGGVTFTSPITFPRKRVMPVLSLISAPVSSNVLAASVDNITVDGARYIVVGSATANISVFAVAYYSVDARL